MAPYYPVTICRSDGLESYVEKGKTVANAPTNLDATPDADGKISYYKKMGVDDAKSVMWRRKLGALLMEKIGGDVHKGMFHDKFV
jgi:hypothetical protein